MTNLQGEEWAGSEDPRGARPAITPRRLEAIWPEARARLIRYVAGRGADPQTAEDIAQEVALRAIDHNVPFHDVDDFCGWAYRVARNLYVDHARTRGRFVELIELADQPGTSDLHGEVEHRLELGRTLRALESLDQSDRAAIVAGVNETIEPTRKAAVRMAVRRHRARARLLRLVEGIAAFWALLKVGKRSVQIAPVAVAACGVLVVLPVIEHLQQQEPPARAPRTVAPVAGGPMIEPGQLKPDRSDTLPNPAAVAPVAARRPVAPGRAKPKAGDGRNTIAQLPGGTGVHTVPKTDNCVLEINDGPDGCVLVRPTAPNPEVLSGRPRLP